MKQGQKAAWWEGICVTLVPFSLCLAGITPAEEAGAWVRIGAAAVICLIGLWGTLRLFHQRNLGRPLCILALTALPLLAGRDLQNSPFAALFYGSLMIVGLFSLLEWKSLPDTKIPLRESEFCRIRTLGSAVILLVISQLALFTVGNQSWTAQSGFLLSGLMTTFYLYRWSKQLSRNRLQAFLCRAGIFLLLLLLIGGFYFRTLRFQLFWQGLLIIVLSFLYRPRVAVRESALDLVLRHPARCLFATFFGLSALGTLLLCTPLATTGNVSTIDAAFLAVSASCVTGLTTLDISTNFTFFGECCMLILIQLGGLGLMSIATIALHAIGKLSLNQEWMMSQVTDTSDRSLLDSLKLILKFTFSVELLGAVLLAFAFICNYGMAPAEALWKGLFVAVSGFCNAGMCLFSNSMEQFYANPLILHTLALLCILGGIAPAVCLLLPRYFMRKPIPLSAELAITATLILLSVGGLSFLIFEWNGILAGLSFWEKINNAWFQATVMRTAGFNSVEVSNLAPTTYLMTLLWMFIGASPGGTGGGLKTTTAAVLALTFWANVTGRNEIIIRNRRIRHYTVYRAVTLLLASLAVLSLSVLMLVVTQAIPERELVFEAISALATVGLSIGATTELDSVGKIIIMLTMFIGRIGPMTIFMILNDPHRSSDSRCPDARIALS